jgi:tetratricopeptide (TPR) repeat protein
VDVSVASLIGAARERFNNRDYYGALYCLEDVVGTGRAWADAHHLRGVCLSLLNRPEEALVEFDQALRLNPRYLEALLHRGVVLIQLGRAEEGAAAFASARAAEGPGVGGLSAPVAARLANEHARLGELYAEAGALSDAVDQYRRAVVLGPTYFDLRLRLARLLLEAGNPLQAIEVIEAILTDRPEWVDARVQLGLARYLAGDVTEARTIWRACQAQRPEFEGIAAYLAMVERIPL